MADDPKWEDLFAPAADESDVGRGDPFGSPPPAAGIAGRPDEPHGSNAGHGAPQTRRQLRADGRTPQARQVPEARQGRRKPQARQQRQGRQARQPNRGGSALAWLGVLVVLLGLGAGAVSFVWLNFEDQVRSVLGWELPIDYEGDGNGEPVVMTIVSGDVGADIARRLEEVGVTMTSKAFYDLLLSTPENPVFMPGSYELEKEMSAESALAALLDPANVVNSTAVIPEGSTLTQTLARLSEGTGVPLAELEAAAVDYPALGVPAGAPSLEGFLFPATYTFEPDTSAQQMLQTMADRMVQALDEAGVAPDDRLRVLTFAALVQKEGGSIEDFAKVARVFQNRIDQGMLLQSDATVSYGSGGTSILTTDAERGDAANLYNTYVHPGLPVGPISMPGDDAIRSVLSPTAGDWLYFVLVNGETGETKFSATFAEHEVAVEEWQAWYRAHPDWDN